MIAAGGLWTAADANALLERGADAIALGRAAICNPDWPIEAQTPSWSASAPSITRAELRDRSVSPIFIEYLTRWKNFVAPD